MQRETIKGAARAFSQGSALTVALAAVSLAFMPAAALAQAAAPSRTPAAVGANLNITPRRLVFDPKTRTATVYIFNQGDTPASFDIKLVDRVMLPDGEIRAVDSAGDSPEAAAAVARLASAHDMVIAAPRRVTLAPGRGQAIRLRATAPAGGDATEYRTHLTVANLPPPDAGLTAEEVANPQPDRLSFHVQSLFGISIPVIVRTQAPDLRAALSGLTTGVAPARNTEDGESASTPTLELTIDRLGANSLFGNIEVRGGAEGTEVIGTARGVGVYPEIDQRALAVPLLRALNPGERLFVTFSDDDVSPGTELARAAFVAP